MVPLGYMLFAVGLIVASYGNIKFLVVAYNRNLWWFFGCLFVPLVDWVFFFLNFKATVKPFGLSLAGLLITGLGGYMAGVVWPD